MINTRTEATPEYAWWIPKEVIKKEQKGSETFTTLVFFILGGASIYCGRRLILRSESAAWVQCAAFLLQMCTVTLNWASLLRIAPTNNNKEVPPGPSASLHPVLIAAIGIMVSSCAAVVGWYGTTLIVSPATNLDCFVPTKNQWIGLAFRLAGTICACASLVFLSKWT